MRGAVLLWPVGGYVLDERIVTQTNVFLLRTRCAAYRESAKPYQSVTNGREGVWTIECFARRAQH